MTDDAAPTRTDFGAPIVAGPFKSQRDAMDAAAGVEGGGIYWESSNWYVHGPAEGGDDLPPLTTYG